MATFPQAPLDAEVSLQLTADSAWTDITTYALQRDGSSAPITVTRGRPDESSTINPASCQMQWNNRDGRFTPGNPTGPYYGQIGRNTPVRVSVPDQITYLRVEDDTTSRAILANSVALEITANLDLRMDMNLSGWSPCCLTGRWSISLGRSWLLLLNGDGTVTFWWSTDGTLGNAVSATSTVPVPLGPGCLRVTLATSTGTVTFFTAATGQINGTFTQLGGTTVAGSTSIDAGTSAIVVGYGADVHTDFGVPGLTGQVFDWQLQSPVGSTVIAHMASGTFAAGAATWTDSHSGAWSVSGTAELSERSYRFHGECSALPVQWDPTGADVWVPLAAGGIMRRLQQGNVPVLPAMRRAVGQQANVQAYWPCEDMTQSNQLATGLASGGFPMYVQQGSLTFASNSDFACSNPLPVINGAVTTGAAGIYTAGTTTAIRFLFSAPAAGDPLSRVMDIYLTGTLGFVRVLYQSGPSNGIDVTAGGGLASTGSIAVDGKPCLVSVELTTSGANVVVALNVVFADGSLQTTTTGTATSVATGVVRSIQVNGGGNTLSKSAIGHIFVQSPLAAISTLDGVGPVAAWAGEAAGNRFARLCAENSIAPRVYGYPNETVAMGTQAVDTIANLLQECEDADHGMLYEPRQCLGLGYRTLRSLTNQSPLTVSYSAAETGDGQQGIGVTYDDQYTVNDWLLTRSNGSSYEATLADGSQMSVSPPPTGAGDYQSTKTLYLDTDTQLADAAGWMLHVSTVNEPRYPVIPLNLARAALSGLYYQIQDAELGDYLAISSPPAWLPPGNVKQLIAGTTEQIGGFFWTLAWQCVPESPYEVLQYDSGLHWDTDASNLHATITSGATTMQVTTGNAASPLWTTSAGDFPFNVIMDGEVMTVTNITGASSPQTFTITRSVNGVVKAHNAGPPLLAVNVYVPPVWALT